MDDVVPAQRCECPDPGSSSSGWEGLWATWSSKKCLCLWQGDWNWVIFKSLPTQAIQWFDDIKHCNIFNVRLDKILTNFGSNLSEGSMFGTSCHHQGLKFIFHAHETDLPLLFPQIEHLLMYTKYPLKWKLFDSCGYWRFVSELHYCSILKTTTGQVLMNVFYLLAKKEPQLIFSQDHHRSSAPLASFSSWDIPGQSTVTSGSLEMALNTDTEG